MHRNEIVDAYQVAEAAVGAVRSAIAVHVASRRWLNYVRRFSDSLL